MMKKVLKVAFCSALFAAVLIVVLNVTGSRAEKKKTLRVAMECAAAPYNWSQSTPEGGAVKIVGSFEYAHGYDVLISKLLAEALDMELEIYKIEWDGIPPAVVTGKVDAAIASMAITEKRKQTVDFTLPYYYTDYVPLVRKNSPQASAKCLADLSGSSATSQLNSVWYEKVDQIPDVEKLPPLDTFPSMIVALQSGKCDVLVVGIPTAMAAEIANPDLMMLDFPAGRGFESTREERELGIAIQKGNTELKEALDSVLIKLTDKDRKALMEEAIRKQPLMQ